MPDLGTLDALAEYWLDEIWEQTDEKVKPLYQRYRDEKANRGGVQVDQSEPAENVPDNDDEDDDDEDNLVKHGWKINDALKNKGPDRCRLGHALKACEKTALLQVDPDADDEYSSVSQAECKFKYCKLYENTKEFGGPNPMVDFLGSKFYACPFDSCLYAVHWDCYGGEHKNLELSDVMLADQKEEIV